MDCRWALEILESARPDSADWQEPQLREAVSHIDECPTCEETFHARQALDRRVGSVMRDVPIPDGLLARLTEALSIQPVPARPVPVGDVEPDSVRSAQSKHASTNRTGEGFDDAAAGKIAVGPATPAVQPAPPQNRRQWLRRAALAATACAVLAGAWFIFRQPAPTLLLAEVERAVPLQLEHLEAFDDNFVAAPPLGWDSDALHLARVAKGYGRGKHDEHQAALVEFQFQGWDGAAVTGVLAVLPTADVVAADDLPGSFSAAIGSPGYVIKPWGGYTTISWNAGELVYICFVPEGDDVQRRLEQILGGEPA